MSTFNPAEEYEIIQDGDDVFGIGGHVLLTVEKGRVFRRIGLRPFQKKPDEGWSMEGNCPKRVMLVGEIRGVKTYIIQGEEMLNIVMTQREINP